MTLKFAHIDLTASDPPDIGSETILRRTYDVLRLAGLPLLGDSYDHEVMRCALVAAQAEIIVEEKFDSGMTRKITYVWESL